MKNNRFYIIKKRPDFVRMTLHGAKVAKSGLVVQTFHRNLPVKNIPSDAVRIGFTATKKIGGATVRNRCKRRLRALVFELLPQSSISGNDYNFIARAITADMPFSKLKKEMTEALTQLQTDFSDVTNERT